MLEYEKKIMLTKEEYEALADRSKGARLETQTNYYFDTDDFSMNGRGITCRIREKHGKYRTTVKIHSGERTCCSVEEHLCESMEYNSDIFDAMGLKLQGELVTARLYMSEDDSCEMVLDRNTYLGHTDFEIEVEYRKGHENKATECLTRVAEYLAASKLIDSVEEFLHRTGTGKSKSQRFFGSKQKEGG